MCIEACLVVTQNGAKTISFARALKTLAQYDILKLGFNDDKL